MQYGQAYLYPWRFVALSTSLEPRGPPATGVDPFVVALGIEPDVGVDAVDAIVVMGNTCRWADLFDKMHTTLDLSIKAKPSSAFCLVTTNSEWHPQLVAARCQRSRL